MSHENGAGKARHFSTKKIINFRFTDEVRNHLNNLALQAKTDMTKYLESLILKQRVRIDPDTCDHPKGHTQGWHDSSILCNKCDSIIEQYGEKIDPPTPLY